jgi:hypothetical protein
MLRIGRGEGNGEVWGLWRGCEKAAAEIKIRPCPGRKRVGTAENARELLVGVYAGRRRSPPVRAKNAATCKHYIAIWLAMYP